MTTKEENNFFDSTKRNQSQLKQSILHRVTVLITTMPRPLALNDYRQ